MIRLAIDTTGPWCAVRLSLPGGEALTDDREIGVGHDAALPMAVAALLDRASLAPADIARIVVCTGPGSFAGVRVGTAFASAFGLVTGAPVVGVSALAAWAAAVPPQGSPRVAVHDAKRGEVIWQGFDVEGAPVEPPTLAPLAEAIARLAARGPVRLTGSGAQLFPANAFARHPETRVDPAVLDRLGALADPSSHRPAPLYARPPDAKLPGGRDP